MSNVIRGRFFLLLALGWPCLSAAPPFLDVFPPSPAIPGFVYKGQLTYSRAYTPSASTWAPGLDEREVFFADLKHSQDPDDTWEIRIGKGGQVYSIRGPFGESQPPQTQPDAHWIDQIFQLVGVSLHKNLATPGHPYFIHQAGDYLDDPAFHSTFYSPMLASGFDPAEHAAYALNWGQQAHIPNVYPAGLLYYERLKDLGSGVIEITYVIYNFGTETIDYLNTPWGGVRKSALPVTLLSQPDGSPRVVSASWGDNQFVRLSDTGGWIVWARDPVDPLSPALALVFGADQTPRPGYHYAPARLRYGTGTPVNDFEVVEVDPYVTLAPGTAEFFRVYLVVGYAGAVKTLSNRLAPLVAMGMSSFTPENADRVPLYLRSTENQTILTTKPQAGAAPVFSTFAQPVAHSRPLFVLRDTRTGLQRLTTDPCEWCTTNHLDNGDSVFKPYDGQVQYAGFLGYVENAEDLAGGKAAIRLLDRVTDRSYLPATDTNRDLYAPPAP